jgi:hypothetical protein
VVSLEGPDLAIAFKARRVARIEWRGFSTVAAATRPNRWGTQCPGLEKTGLKSWRPLRHGRDRHRLSPGNPSAIFDYRKLIRQRIPVPGSPRLR